MKVLKRNGTLQDFDAEKIRYSIARASDAIGEPATEGDLHILIKQVLRTLETPQRQTIRFDELHKLVVSTLTQNGFNDVAKSYDQSELSSVGASL